MADQPPTDSGILMELVEERSNDIINDCLIEENVDKNEKDHIHMDDTTVPKEGIIPTLGMVFDSRDEAFLFYKAYGYYVGFGVIRRSKHDFHGNPSSITFTCSKGGKPRVKPSSSKIRFKPTSKTECPAMMFVKDQYFRNQWLVQGLELNHNHELIPDMVRFTKCFGELPVSLQKQLEFNDKAGLPLQKSIGAVISPGETYENCSFSQKDCRNYVEKGRRSNLGKGDAEALKEYFYYMQAQNPNFYHSIDVDDEGRLRNVFWADARSREAYQYFGDVISFDTSYLTNKYALPLLLFVGVNHHGQSILLGCGLLADETTEAYIWIFTRFLTCMNGKAPNAVITDHCKAIRGGVEAVFTHARHRFCLWHIVKKFAEKLGGYKQRESICFMLSKAIYDSLSVFQFENTWKETIGKYKLETNDWLASLYQDRERWVPIYVKDTFWAGMSTTQRSESSTFFDGCITSKTSLKQFVEQYGNALKSQYEKEAEEDFRSFHMEPQVISPLKLEKQVAKVYTFNMFMKFQAEVKEMISLNIVRVGKDGPVVTYQVTELAQDSHIDYRAVYNTAEQEVWCICRSFQFRGILCRHALCVLRQELVMELPSKYILDRWRKDFKRLHAFASSSHVAPMREMRPYDGLYTRGQQYLAEIVELGSTNKETNGFALKVLKEARDKVITFHELQRGVAEITKNKQSITMASNSIDINQGFENRMVLPRVLLIPLPPRPKGHLPTKTSVGKQEKESTKRKKALQKGRDAIVHKDQSLANKSKRISIDVQAGQFDDTSGTTPIGTQESCMSLVQPIQFNGTRLVAPTDTQENLTSLDKHLSQVGTWNNLLFQSENLPVHSWASGFKPPLEGNKTS